MRFIDAVAGVAGFRLGMERAGHECVWSCEIDRWCRAVYRFRFGETPAGDIRQVRPEEIPDFDCLCAGFPCQSFSVAGKRGGFEDARGALFYEICRIAGAKRPPLLLLENVKGLLSADNRLAFGVVLESLGELGYDVEWQVLNSKDFGVPQNRERVFIVGYLGGFGGRQVFPVTQDDIANPEGEKETKRRSVHTISGGYGRQNARGTYIAPALTGGGHSGGLHSQTLGIIAEGEPMILSKVGVGQKYQLHKNECSTLRGMTRNNNVPMVVADRTRTYANQGRNLESPKPHTNALSKVQKDNLVVLKKHRKNEIRNHGQTVPTLTESHEHYGGTNSPLVASDARIRRLTPRECERLQGFPDDFTKYGINEKGKTVEISDTQRYKMMGNAVTVNVVEFIAGRLPNG